MGTRLFFISLSKKGDMLFASSVFLLDSLSKVLETHVSSTREKLKVVSVFSVK